MSNKVTLTYENNEYIVRLGEAVLAQDNDEERAILAFKHAVKNNMSQKTLGFEEMITKVRALNMDKVEINETYKSMQCGDVKYFYHTGKVFYVGEGKMVLLLGGFEAFYTMLNLVAEQKVDNIEMLVKLCVKVIEEKANYSLNEDEMTIASAAFSYGNVGYSFANHKLNKGTSSEKSTFNEFVKLVLETL